MRSRVAIVAALLMGAGPAWAEGAPDSAKAPSQKRGASRMGMLSGVTLEADRAAVTGDIEVDGALVGEFELKVRRAVIQEGELVVMGPLTATVESKKQAIGEVKLVLSDPEDVCDAMALTPPALVFDQLDLAVDEEPVDLALDADTARGYLLSSTLCAAAHLAEAEEGEDVPQAAMTDVLSIANRAIEPRAHRAVPVAAAEPTASPVAAAPQPVVVPSTPVEKPASKPAVRSWPEYPDDVAPAETTPSAKPAARPASEGPRTVTLPNGTRVEIRPATVELKPIEPAPEPDVH